MKNGSFSAIVVFNNYCIHCRLHTSFNTSIINLHSSRYQLITVRVLLLKSNSHKTLPKFCAFCLLETNCCFVKYIPTVKLKKQLFPF